MKLFVYSGQNFIHVIFTVSAIYMSLICGKVECGWSASLRLPNSFFICRRDGRTRRLRGAANSPRPLLPASHGQPHKHILQEAAESPFPDEFPTVR